MTPLLQAQRLEFSIDAATLIDSVDIEVAAGELVALIGPNGAGKSTLLELLAGDRRPSGGIVLLGGQHLGSLDALELARHRAVVPQHVADNVPFSGRRVVEMGRHPLRGTGRGDPATDRAVVDRLLRAVDVHDAAELPFSALSGGEQRRVVLARALAQEAPLLLLDEPASSLDIAHQQMTMRLLRETAASGAGVLAVLHDLNLAASYADRVVIMDEGRIRASGEPSHVMTAEALSSLYGHRLQVQRHPTRRGPLVVVID